MAHVTFIHGVANKPEPEALMGAWKDALSDNDGIDLDSRGISSSMVYWADMLYAHPAQQGAAQEATALEVEAVVDAGDADMRWLSEVPDEERQFVDSLGRKLGLADVTATRDEVAPDPIVDKSLLEAIPLPPWLKKRLMRVVLRDVHHYLYDVPFSPRAGETYKIRTEVRARVLSALQEADGTSGPHVVVGHSLGSVIAYDALTALDDAPSVDALVTVGSPLGMSEIRDGLAPPWTDTDGWPSQRLGDGTWWNVFDAMDPVCGLVDCRIAPHYLSAGRTRIADVGVINTGYWRHSVSKYLGQPAFRSVIAELVG